MKEAEKIAKEVLNNEMNQLIKDMVSFLKEKGHHIGFFEQLAIANYFLAKNNKLRTKDRAVITFRKVKE